MNMMHHNCKQRFFSTTMHIVCISIIVNAQVNKCFAVSLLYIMLHTFFACDKIRQKTTRLNKQQQQRQQKQMECKHFHIIQMLKNTTPVCLCIDDAIDFDIENCQICIVLVYACSGSSNASSHLEIYETRKRKQKKTHTILSLASICQFRCVYVCMSVYRIDSLPIRWVHLFILVV